MVSRRSIIGRFVGLITLFLCSKWNCVANSPGIFYWGWCRQRRGLVPIIWNIYDLVNFCSASMLFFFVKWYSDGDIADSCGLLCPFRCISKPSFKPTFISVKSSAQSCFITDVSTQLKARVTKCKWGKKINFKTGPCNSEADVSQVRSFRNRCWTLLWLTEAL